MTRNATYVHHIDLKWKVCWLWRQGRLNVAARVFYWGVAIAWHWSSVYNTHAPTQQNIGIYICTTVKMSLGLVHYRTLMHKASLCCGTGLERENVSDGSKQRFSACKLTLWLIYCIQGTALHKDQESTANLWFRAETSRSVCTWFFDWSLQSTCTKCWSPCAPGTAKYSSRLTSGSRTLAILQLLWYRFVAPHFGLDPSFQMSGDYSCSWDDHVGCVACAWSILSQGEGTLRVSNAGQAVATIVMLLFKISMTSQPSGDDPSGSRAGRHASTSRASVAAWLCGCGCGAYAHAWADLNLTLEFNVNPLWKH